jgi:hypothetical protein
MCRKVCTRRVLSIIVVLLVAATVAGCTSAPTPLRNQSGVVNEYSANPTRYVATPPIEMKTFSGENSLYGKLTVNGTVPPGYVYQLKPSEYHVSQSDEPVDAIGLLEVDTVSMDFTSVSSDGSEYSSSEAPRYSFVDPQGNFRIDGLTSGPMHFFVFRMCTAPGVNYREYFIHNDQGYGFLYYNLTGKVSQCDLDLTDVKFFTRSSDGCDFYYATGILKNPDA